MVKLVVHKCEVCGVILLDEERFSKNKKYSYVYRYCDECIKRVFDCKDCIILLSL